MDNFKRASLFRAFYCSHDNDAVAGSKAGCRQCWKRHHKRSHKKIARAKLRRQLRNLE